MWRVSADFRLQVFITTCTRDINDHVLSESCILHSRAACAAAFCTLKPLSVCFECLKKLQGVYLCVRVCMVYVTAINQMLWSGASACPRGSEQRPGCHRICNVMRETETLCCITFNVERLATITSTQKSQHGAQSGADALECADGVTGGVFRVEYFPSSWLVRCRDADDGLVAVDHAKRALQ